MLQRARVALQEGSACASTRCSHHQSSLQLMVAAALPRHTRPHCRPPAHAWIKVTNLGHWTRAAPPGWQPPPAARRPPSISFVVACLPHPPPKAPTHPPPTTRTLPNYLHPPGTYCISDPPLVFIPSISGFPPLLLSNHNLPLTHCHGSSSFFIGAHLLTHSMLTGSALSIQRRHPRPRRRPRATLPPLLLSTQMGNISHASIASTAHHLASCRRISQTPSSRKAPSLGASIPPSP